MTLRAHLMLIGLLLASQASVAGGMETSAALTAAYKRSLQPLQQHTAVVTRNRESKDVSGQVTFDRDVTTIKYDLGRFQLDYHGWSPVTRLSDLPEEPDSRAVYTWDRTAMYQFAQEQTPADSAMYITPASLCNWEHYLVNGYPVSSLDSYLLGDNVSLAAICDSARSTHVQNQTDRIGDIECSVLEVESAHGSYKLWFSPSRGGALVKAHWVKHAADLYYSTPLSVMRSGEKGPPATEYVADLDSVQFERIGDAWVAVSGVVRTRMVFGDGKTLLESSDLKRQSVKLGPAAVSEPIAPFADDGTRVFLVGSTKDGIPREWRDGKVVAVQDPSALSEIDSAAAAADAQLTAENSASRRAHAATIWMWRGIFALVLISGVTVLIIKRFALRKL